MGPRALDSSSFLLLGLVLLVVFVPNVNAFGAGNIASVSKVEGLNWRHGDIEDILLSLIASTSTKKKFSKLDVKRVYFGNWLRDYSQAVDVGALKMVSAEAIRLLLWILGFMSFGYGTKEFEVTSDRLGCYRPEEHIDNPKDYADNEDARRYDRRLRAPVDERRELAIDERTGLKMYIASEDQGITTSAGLVRDLLRRCIEQGRKARRDNDEGALFEAYRLLGTSNHCLEDYSAHSNYVELCLIELGERNVFPHVGRDTQVQVQGARQRVWPIITGTFGGVDFLHSVMGEVSDKATQSEIEELEGTISQAEKNRKNSSVIQDLLDKLPDGILGGGEADKANELQQNADAASVQNMEISPKDPEEFTRQAEDLRRQIYPIIEFHDNLMREITETIDKIPILPDLLEQFQEQLNIFVFGLIAPYILPVIKQVKTELSTGSSEIIESSRQQQLIVFHDDNSSDPTHSMISKDHFSNVLNEPAGKVATQVIKWAVPQIVECWDDERSDAERVINRIINGVFHHPALREGGEDGARDARSQMFRVVESWWQSQSDRSRDDLRSKLSREGVENGKNHKEGVHDKGHGCGKPLGMPNVGTASSSGAIGGVLGAGVMGALQNASGGQSSGYGNSQQNKVQQDVSNKVGEAVGGGLLGSIVGGLAGGIGGSLLGGDSQKSSSQQESSYGGGSSYSQSQSYSQSSNRPSSRHETSGGYGQQRTDHSSGGRQEHGGEDPRQSYGAGGVPGGFGSGERQSGFGGEQRQESRTENYGGGRQGHSSESTRYGKKQDDSDDDDDEDDYEKRAKKERKKREKEEKKRRKEQEYSQYGGGYRKKDDSEDDDDDDSDDEKKQKKYKRKSNEYKPRRNDNDDDNRRRNRSREREQPSRQEYGGGRQEESGHGSGRQEYGGRQEESGYGSGRQEYGGRQEESGYGSGRQEYGGRQEESGYGSGRQQHGGRQEESGYGGGRQEYGGGREERSGYGQESSGYGEQRQEYGGGRRDEEESRGHGGRRGNDEEESGSHGRRRGGEDEEESSGYGSRRRDNDESEGYSRY